MEREQGIGSMPELITPLEKAGVVDNGEKETQGFERTLKFLQAAIAEGAHLKIPTYIRWGRDCEISEEQWARQKNIIGVYFGSPAVLEDIAKMYEITREMVRVIIERGFNNLWRNCSLETQAQFPFKEIALKKPLTQRSRDRISMVQGGIRVLIERGLRENKGIQEIKDKNNLSGGQINSARSRLKKSGIEVPSLAARKLLGENVELEKRLINAVTDQEKQELLNQVTETFARVRLRSNKPVFLSVSKVIIDAEFSIGFQRKNFGAFLASLKDSGFPVGEASKIMKKTGRIIGTYHFILIKDRERAKEILLKDPDLQKFKRS